MTAWSRDQSNKVEMEANSMINSPCFKATAVEDYGS